MAMKRRRPVRYSIAEAKDQLPALVRDVAEAPVEITRRGKAVALVISIDEFERLRQGRRNFAEAYARFRAGVDADASLEAWAALQDLRDTSPGRAPS